MISLRHPQGEWTYLISETMASRMCREGWALEFVPLEVRGCDRDKLSFRGVRGGPKELPDSLGINMAHLGRVVQVWPPHGTALEDPQGLVEIESRRIGRVFLLEGAEGAWNFAISDTDAERLCWHGTAAVVALRLPLDA